MLGLSKHRYRATESQIRTAHRKKVLRHHPDKRAATGSSEDDSFFKCIQKATEILLNPEKRRQFDSVDEGADVEPPGKKQAQKQGWFTAWNPVFDSEARFSKVQPVPRLGDDDSTKDDVETFYNFWYNFDSWRTFEYQDEDVPDDNENRDQKRMVERKNNNARKKKKAADTKRLRELVDACLAGDERIKRFQQKEREGKNKKRVEREAAEKKAVEDKKAAAEQEAARAKEAEEVAKVAKQADKRSKEAAKNAAKKNKRVLKSSVKDANYLLDKGAGDAGPQRVDEVLNAVDALIAKVDNEELADLAGTLGGLKVEETKGVWQQEVQKLVERGKIKEGQVGCLM